MHHHVGLSLVVLVLGCSSSRVTATAAAQVAAELQKRGAPLFGRLCASRCKPPKKKRKAKGGKAEL